MKNKDEFVYVVECSSGSYDDYRRWIAGIFESIYDAEKYAQELNGENERLREIECPIETLVEDMTGEESEVYYSWWDDNYDAMEWNGATIKEYPINKPC